MTDRGPYDTGEAVSDELSDQSIPPASYDLSRSLLLVLEEQYPQ